MKKEPIFTGSCTAIVTPYCESGIDFQKMGELVDFQAKNGTSALVVCGTTGENATQNLDEHAELIDFVAKHNAGRMKLIAGIGSNDTNTAYHLGKAAEAAKYDGVLMVTPYYTETTQAGLVQHFTYVADRVNVPMVLYNVPSRTGIGITADTYKILSQHPNINGAKEASGDMSLFSKTRYLCGDDLNIWSGNDDNTVAMMALGAKGVISVASNIVPKAVADMCDAALKGDFATAQAIHMQYAELFSTLFIETNPIPVKTAMNLMGMGVGHLRLPLVDMQPKNLETLKACMQKLNLI